MTINTHRPDADGVVRLRVAGEIDMATAGDLENTIREATTPLDVTTVIVDLADVTFCDSSGIGALVRAQMDAARRGTAVQIADPRGCVLHVLQVTGVLDTLTNPRTP